MLWNALIAGDIDLYPDYTGTLSREILAEENLRNEADIRARLAEMGLVMSRPLGFNNTYVLGMVETRAEALGIQDDFGFKEVPRFEAGIWQ